MNEGTDGNGNDLDGGTRVGWEGDDGKVETEDVFCARFLGFPKPRAPKGPKEALLEKQSSSTFCSIEVSFDRGFVRSTLFLPSPNLPFHRRIVFTFSLSTDVLTRLVHHARRTRTTDQSVRAETDENVGRARGREAEQTGVVERRA